jgi:hypothetical protein
MDNGEFTVALGHVVFLSLTTEEEKGRPKKECQSTYD